MEFLTVCTDPMQLQTTNENSKNIHIRSEFLAFAVGTLLFFSSPFFYFIYFFPMPTACRVVYFGYLRAGYIFFCHAFSFLHTLAGCQKGNMCCGNYKFLWPWLGAKLCPFGRPGLSCSVQSFPVLSYSVLSSSAA